MQAQRGVNCICLSAFVDNSSNTFSLLTFFVEAHIVESKKVVSAASSPLHFQRKSYETQELFLLHGDSGMSLAA